MANSSNYKDNCNRKHMFSASEIAAMMGSAANNIGNTGSVHFPCPHGVRCCMNSWPTHSILGTNAGRPAYPSVASDGSHCDDGSGDSGCRCVRYFRTPDSKIGNAAAASVATAAVERAAETRSTGSGTVSNAPTKAVKLDTYVSVLCDEHTTCEYYVRTCYEPHWHLRLHSPPPSGFPSSPTTMEPRTANSDREQYRLKRSLSFRNEELNTGSGTGSNAPTKAVEFDPHVKVQCDDLCEEHETCEYYVRTCYEPRLRLGSPPPSGFPSSPTPMEPRTALTGRERYRLKRGLAFRKAGACARSDIGRKVLNDDIVNDGGSHTSRSDGFQSPCDGSEAVSSASAAVPLALAASSASGEANVVGDYANAVAHVESKHSAPLSASSCPLSPQRLDESFAGSTAGQIDSAGRQYKRGYLWLRGSASMFTMKQPSDTSVGHAPEDSQLNSTNALPRRTPIAESVCCRCSSCTCCNCCSCRKYEWTANCSSGGSESGGNTSTRRYRRGYEWLRGDSQASEHGCHFGDT